MTAGTNVYCERLGIAVPSLAAARTQREASTYALLIVALLERGEPMTLADVAARFAAAGVVAHADEAYASLKRCRPARPPVYREGELYGLDPYDAELDLWAFRLGLRPADVLPPAPAPVTPRAPSDQPLTVAELREAWRDASLNQWSAQRLVLAVLDAHGRPMPPAEVVAFVAACTKWHQLVAGPDTFRRKNAAVAILDDGSWAIPPGVPELAMARDAVRDALARAQRSPRPPPGHWEEAFRVAEQRRAAHAAELARLGRVIVHAFPPKAPHVVVLVDIESRELVTLVGEELASVATRLAPYDILTGVDIRGTLRALGIDPRDRRLAELGPPQKSIQTSSSGRTLKITTAMLIQGSCHIRRPLADDKQLRGLLAKGDLGKLRARLEADAKALFALHEYGRLHGNVRLLHGALDEIFSAPWHHQDEPTLYRLMREAKDLGMGIIAVVGPAPSWDEPWARAEPLAVRRGQSEHSVVLFDAFGDYVDERDVQLARLEIEIN